MPRAKPLTGENAIRFGLEYLRRNIVFACKCLRAAEIRLGGLEESSHFILLWQLNKKDRRFHDWMPTALNPVTVYPCRAFRHDDQLMFQGRYSTGPTQKEWKPCAQFYYIAYFFKTDPAAFLPLAPLTPPPPCTPEPHRYSPSIGVL